MKLDVRTSIADYEGKPLTGNDGKPQPLREYFVSAVNNTLPNENYTPEQKNKAYEISTKMYKSNKVDLTIDDCKFILDRVSLLYGPLVVGRITDVLEQRKAPDILAEEDLHSAPEDESKKPIAQEA